MGEELEAASKAVGEITGVLVDKSGALEPSRELAEALTFGIHHRFYPRIVSQAMKPLRRSGHLAYLGMPTELFQTDC
jgi:hypothetical protein